MLTMSTMFARIVVVFCCMYACAAHLCMLNPSQRTPLKDINKPGSTSCILLKGPCGGTKPSASPVSLVGGSNFTLVFQKNLDHFHQEAPGYWSVSIADDQTARFRELYRVPDTSTPSLTLYTATITVPKVTAAGNKPVPMVIQTRYLTNNPNAPPVFYQCGDVLVR